MTRMLYYMLCDTGHLWGNKRATEENDTLKTEANLSEIDPELSVFHVHPLCSFILFIYWHSTPVWANEMLAQRCKQSQSTRKRNGEAFPEGNTANYLIVQINCSFNGGWCWKYSTRAANKPEHNAGARLSASHCFPHKHVLLFRQTSFIYFY